MNEGQRQSAQSTRLKDWHLYRREFIGFTSTRPPRPETRHEYELVGDTFYVRHRDLDRELAIVFTVLLEEAKMDKRWGSLRAQRTVLRQFIGCSTHIIFK